jgi:hypothetical protein
VLPAFGLFVGLATNWIALNVIFRPLEAKRLGPWTVQGLFLRRQREVAEIWCDIVTRDILTLHDLVQAMLEGPRADRTRALIRKHIKLVVDRSLGPLRGLAQAAVGLRGFADLKDSVGATAVEVAIEPFRDREFVLGRAGEVAEELRQRMTQMPPVEFQDLLRPCFQEDELKLVLLGGALGLLAGLAQLQWVFGGGCGEGGSDRGDGRRSTVAAAPPAATRPARRFRDAAHQDAQPFLHQLGAGDRDAAGRRRRHARRLELGDRVAHHATQPRLDHLADLLGGLGELVVQPLLQPRLDLPGDAAEGDHRQGDGQQAGDGGGDGDRRDLIEHGRRRA